MLDFKNATITSNMAIAILDAGSQYSKLIENTVSACGVSARLLPLNTTEQQIVAAGYKGIIITGGPSSVVDADVNFDWSIFDLRVPVLGVCYGFQMLAWRFGGQVTNTVDRSDGQTEIRVDPTSQLFAGLAQKQTVLLTHGDSVVSAPQGFKVNASGKAIYGIERQHLYGIQFHPEVNLTTHGKKMYQNFVYSICGCVPSTPAVNKCEQAIAEIREAAQNRPVLCLVSGGVDSTVCAVLLGKALPAEQVLAVHIDTGFMRRDESALVKKALAAIGIQLQVINAARDFARAIGDETDPEKIRQIIGNTFIKILREYLDIEKYVLLQGTLRPDLIESASQQASDNASVIKTHHNDTALVRELRAAGKVIEPLREYHKNDVREIGKKLGIPDNLLYRQPFPGPGLAIRVVCDEYRKDFAMVNKKLDKYRDRYNLHLLPIRSVGVQGDHRSYKYVCGVTASRPEWGSLLALAKEIPQRIPEIGRVVYIFGKVEDVTYTTTKLYPAQVDLLRQADHMVAPLVAANKFSQMPIILIPVSFEKPGQRSIVIRTIITDNFMTGVVANPCAVIGLDSVVQQLAQLPGVSRVCYDLTCKPPGTTEWL